MSAIPRRSLLFGIVLSVAVLATWLATGSRGYTALTTIEIVESAPDPDDPLTQAGFYDSAPVRTVRETPGFHLGLLPTPSGLLDLHALSVLTLLMIAWAPFVILFGRNMRRARSGRDASAEFAQTHSPRSR